jgi:hypothetical protein
MLQRIYPTDAPDLQAMNALYLTLEFQHCRLVRLVAARDERDLDSP